MAAFARVRTRSFLSKLWPLKLQAISNETYDNSQKKEFLGMHEEQNKRFLEVVKNGGIWFS